MQVLPFAFEEVVANRKHNIQIAALRACAPRRPRPCSECVLFFHALRHLDRKLDSFVNRVSSRHVWQGSLIIDPRPEHMLQVRATEKNPCW